MERSDLRGKSRRKRRRRSQGKERVDVLSLVSPVRHCDAAASSARDAGSSGTGSLEVKENQHHKTEVDGNRLQKCRPPPSCRTLQRHGAAAQRKQPLADGQDQPLHWSPAVQKPAAWAVTQKNALVQLNELRPGLRYQIVSRTGPLHAPLFSVAVEVDGFHFEGRGRTKKQAKMRAAELALRSFIQFPNAPQAHAALEKNFACTTLDFTADNLDTPKAFLRESEASEKRHLLQHNRKRLVHLTLDLVSSANPKRQALGSSLLERFSPVALLDELRPGLSYVCQAESVPGRLLRNFVMVVRLEGRVFEGCGRSKRRAKAQAAAAALQSLYSVSLRPERKVRGLQGGRTKGQPPQVFAESIFHLVREKFAQLAATCLSTSHVRHKVLAGIVMTRGLDLGSAQVVSLATGTKCLALDNVSDHDSTLSDCHAEVLSRRALVRFLYSQLELLLCESSHCEEQSIFVPDKGGCGGVRLRDGVLFHMYVSSSPCGDARLNCPYETSATYPSRRFRCHLRVKVNGGEGTLPVTAQRANQKWDSMSAGQPQVTMSCTDKLAKWSVVGLQGALLSHLVEPVYLHSLTVGTLSHTGHLARALTRRLAPVKHLPFPYRRRQPALSCLSDVEARPSGKAPNVSVNWSRGDGGLEEISTSTGRRHNSGAASQLCRSSLFSRWRQLQHQISGAGVSMVTYEGSKVAAGRYQRALQQFTGAQQGAGLGTWMREAPPQPGQSRSSVCEQLMSV